MYYLTYFFYASNIYQLIYTFILGKRFLTFITTLLSPMILAINSKLYLLKPFLEKKCSP